MSVSVYMQLRSTETCKSRCTQGSWWLANLEMEAALRYADYELRVEWGEGNHSGTHGASVLPDTLRWMWPRSQCTPKL